MCKCFVDLRSAPEPSPPASSCQRPHGRDRCLSRLSPERLPCAAGISVFLRTDHAENPRTIRVNDSCCCFVVVREADVLHRGALRQVEYTIWTAVAAERRSSGSYRRSHTAQPRTRIQFAHPAPSHDRSAGHPCRSGVVSSEEPAEIRTVDNHYFLCGGVCVVPGLLSLVGGFVSERRATTSGVVA